jgi:hypothetical protein
MDGKKLEYIKVAAIFFSGIQEELNNRVILYVTCLVTLLAHFCVRWFQLFFKKLTSTTENNRNNIISMLTTDITLKI